MENSDNKDRKILEISTQLAEINCIISATGAIMISMNTETLNACALMSISAFSLNTCLLAYNIYELYKLEKEDSNEKKAYQKKLKNPRFEKNYK